MFIMSEEHNMCIKKQSPSFLVPLQGKNREKELQKEKVKDKDREPKEKMCGIHSNGHHLVPGSFSSCATCSLCSKALQKKHGLQCTSE